MKEKKSLGRRIWGVVSTVLVVLLVLIAIALTGARVFGFSVYTIISGSMQPTYNVGDLIYVKKVSPAEVEIGDAITFVLNDDLVVATHRVVAIDEESQHFYTKGDNNQVEDVAPVHFYNLIGKPVFKIPLLGYVSNWIQNPPGTYIAIAIIIILLGLAFIPDLFMKANDEDKAIAAKKAKELEKSNGQPDQLPENEPQPADRLKQIEDSEHEPDGLEVPESEEALGDSENE